MGGYKFYSYGRTYTDLETREPGYETLPVFKVHIMYTATAIKSSSYRECCNSYSSEGILICPLYIFCARNVAFCYIRGRREVVTVSVTKQIVSFQYFVISYFHILHYTQCHARAHAHAHAHARARTHTHTHTRGLDQLRRIR